MATRSDLGGTQYVSGKYIVVEKDSIVAILDTEHENYEPEYPFLHEHTGGVVWSERGEKATRVCSSCGGRLVVGMRLKAGWGARVNAELERIGAEPVPEYGPTPEATRAISLAQPEGNTNDND